MTFFEGRRRLLSGMAVVNDGGLSKEECIRLANGNGWWYSYAEKSRAKKAKELRWHFIKVSNKGAIRQEDYTRGGKVCCPPRLFRVAYSKS